MEKNPVPLKKPAKIRLDLLLVERSLVPSRARASALILAGRVLVNEQKLDKPGTSVPEDAKIRLLGEEQQYVSRGGLKLAAALAHWPIMVPGRSCLDIGASTGGFTDCLLQHGAAHVTAVDTGFGQIAMQLRTDPRVRLIERTNARLLQPGSLAIQSEVNATGSSMNGTGFSMNATGSRLKGTGSSMNATGFSMKGTGSSMKGTGLSMNATGFSMKGTGLSMKGTGFSLKGTGFSPYITSPDETGALAPEGTQDLTLLVMDVSFISATLVLPPVFAAAPALTEAVILVKPQFEAGRGHIGKGGIVRDPQAHQLAIDRVADSIRSLNWQVVEVIPSPITGMEGNKEFLLYARRELP